MDEKDILDLVNKKGYAVNEVMLRRIRGYGYKAHTTLSVEEDRIVLKSELPIKGVYDTLILYPNGKSKLNMEFD